MPVRSIIDLDIDDRKFLAFKRHFDQLQDNLKKMPATWAAITQKVTGTGAGLGKVVEEATAARTQASLFSDAVEEASKHTTHSATRWGAIAEGAKKAAGHVQIMTRNFLAWTGIGGGTFTGHGGLLRLLAFGGGLAFGTTFGIDRLAGAAAQRRQQMLAFGTTYGGLESTEAAFGRFGGPNLQAVAGARYDISQRVGLLGAGLSQSELTGDTAQVSVALLKNLKRLADNTDPRFFAQVIQARKLDNLTSPEQLAILRATSPEEFRQQLGQQSEWERQLQLDPKTLRAYQDLSTYLDFAGRNIKKTFIEGLAPLATSGAFEKLSKSVNEVIKAFFDAAQNNHWIESLSGAIADLAKSMSEGEFTKTVKNFVDDITSVAGAFHSVFSFLNSGPEMPGMGTAVTSINTGIGSAWNAVKNTFNPMWGPTGNGLGNNPEAAIKALAGQLTLSENRDHLDTLSQLVPSLVPAGERDSATTAAYVSDISRRTGYGGTRHLDLDNPEVLAKVVAAIIAHQHQDSGGYDKYKDAKVVVTILDHTGANVVSTVNGMKTGGGP